ncbi:hypothetical protein ACIHCV_38365 [Streptomyces sp. NPDC051956]|uniref:hypothetical protein n=1 Tax=Streptomyces sp. NPDC051956 TaxID=3365677 RepID=UPI0037D5CE02
MIAPDVARSKGNCANAPQETAAPSDRSMMPKPRLAYVDVACTRQCLDLGGLSWIHDYPDGAHI